MTDEPDGDDDVGHPRVLWFAQNRPENISVGRELLADYLRSDGLAVTQVATDLRAIVDGLRHVREYDVVIGTTRAGALAGLVVSTVGRLPFVVDQIDPFSQFAWKVPGVVAWTVLRLENLAIRAADHVLWVYESEFPRIEARADSTARTGFGVEFDRFHDPDPAAVEAARDRLEALDLADDVLLYVGGLELPYHVHELIEAMDHLEGWSLVVLGAGSLEDDVREAHRTRDDVEFLGTVPYEEVAGYYHCADVGISLVDDARTLKVLEYMAAGLPVVHLDGEARERFGDVLFYCDRDPRTVAEAVRAAADATPDEERYRSIASENSWRRIADDYRDAVRTVLPDQ